MKDENDNCTVDLVDHLNKKKAKRLPGQSIYSPPAGAKPHIPAGLEGTTNAVVLTGFYGWLVPVSFVAKDWGVTPRRIRALLESGRLVGRQLENGYWEVSYPYQHVMGRRGPPLKRSQKAAGKRE